jgi:polysaccharide biosynthesis/export protein
MSSFSLTTLLPFGLAAMVTTMWSLPEAAYSADAPAFPQPPHLFEKPAEMNGKDAPAVGPALPAVGPALPAISHPQSIEKLSNIVSDAYTIGAEDVLEITVWRNQDLSKTVQVRPDGRFSLPVIRDVLAVGKTPSQLADEITRKLREYVQNPVVAISVKEVNSYSIFVLGEVVKPGKYPLKSRTTLLQGITIAGGFTPVAARNQVVVFRFGDNAAGMQTLTSSYDDIVLRGVIAQNLELKAGDTVVVPSEAMVVFPGHQ